MVDINPLFIILGVFILLIGILTLVLLLRS